MNEEIILGVDPGTQITGFGLIKTNGSTMQAIDYGCIRPPPALPLSDRYLIIFEAIEHLIVQHKPAAVVVETQFVQKNAQSAIKLGMARGVIIIAAKRNGSSVVEYAPSKAKKAIVGNGKASKYQVQCMVQSLLRLAAPPSPEDAADALALAICHAQAKSINFLIGKLL